MGADTPPVIHPTEALFPEAEAILAGAAAELAEIHRSKDFSLWAGEAGSRLSKMLWPIQPFRPYRELGTFDAEGFCVSATPKLGLWVVSRLVERCAPAEIIARFQAEVSRNIGGFEDVVPLYGVALNESVTLADGLVLEPRAHDIFERIFQMLPFADLRLPEGTGFLRHRFEVSPAFRRPGDAETPASIQPDVSDRRATRERVRLACLLASAGPVLTPVVAVLPDEGSVIGKDRGSLGTHPDASLLIFTLA